VVEVHRGNAAIAYLTDRGAMSCHHHRRRYLRPNRVHLHLARYRGANSWTICVMVRATQAASQRPAR